jgi:branched-chain amino acid transport system permease protein
MRAVIEKREAATIVGIDVDRIQAISFALGFATAALAGALVSMLEQISPFTGFPFTIAAFIVIILGGLGNLFAGLVAALLLGALETYGVALTSANMRSVLLYGAFVAALVLFPKGIFARRTRAA